MAMIVVCPSCRSRFQLDASLLKGAKGARIRCRNCGDGIVVRSADARDPARDPEPEAAVRPPPVPASQQIHRLEDLFLPPSGGSSVAGVVAIAPRTRLHAIAPYLLIAVSLLCLAAGAWYLLFAPDSGSRSPAPRLATAAGAPALETAYEILEAEGYYGASVEDRNVYVIRGAVENVGKGPSGGIRIRATLIGPGGRVYAEGGAYAGNQIDEGLLKHMNPVRVKEFLGLRYGERNENRDIPAGGVLPFMVVFYDPPDMVESFEVEASDADSMASISPPPIPTSTQRN